MGGLNLPDNVKKTIHDFTESVRKVYGTGLISLILYGSAASSEFTGKRSNINLAVVLNDTSLSSLDRISGLINKRKFAILNPVFFTEDYIRTSTDVFPIEFLDMKENHVVLYGKDVFKDLQIDTRNLRFQCEQELKSKILSIKSTYLRVRNKFFLKFLLFKALTSVLHIMRNLIRLKGKEPSYKKEDLLGEIAKEFSIDVVPLRSALDAKNRKIRLSSRETVDLFGRLVETLEHIGNKIDSL